MSTDRKHLLVVDDDVGLRELLVRYLSDNGYAVAGVADGEAMKRHLATYPVDLVLLDVMLPGESGLSLARTLTAQAAPAIIMLSARGEEVDDERLGGVPHRGEVRGHPHDVLGRKLDLVGPVHRALLVVHALNAIPGRGSTDGPIPDAVTRQAQPSAQGMV